MPINSKIKIEGLKEIKKGCEGGWIGTRNSNQCRPGKKMTSAQLSFFGIFRELSAMKKHRSNPGLGKN
jgi:hypothetical protein